MNLEDKVKELGSKYDNLRVQSVEQEDGKLVMRLQVLGGPQLPELPVDEIDVLDEKKYTETIGTVEQLNPLEFASLRTINIDPLSRNDLDLTKKSILRSTPQELYDRSLKYYKTKDVYGTAINALTNFAAKGFENDIDDPTIKNFYDTWVLDSGFDDIVQKIFFDFFRVGLVRTYKVMGKYEPKISYLSSVPGKKAPKVKEKAARKNRFTNTHIPIAYTILNPVYIDIKGSLLFGQTLTYLKARAGEELKPVIEAYKKNKKSLSEFQRKIIESIPQSWKTAIENSEDIPLDPELLGSIDYRRMPYERYPLPRGARSFDSLEFKEALRTADYSTLDGIINYILKITVGDKEKPATQESLERVSEMFDTLSKSFKVVWNHTMQIERISNDNVGEILGPKKYEQVNSDITGALGIVRSLLDGTGEASAESIGLSVKALIEEINYARTQVERWIYSEYSAVAKVMGFDRIPRVRFDNMALRDELQMMTIVQGLVDRRMISYRTGMEMLGFDYQSEVSQMDTEIDLVAGGTLGIIGSPYQQEARQPTQGTPKGTPSEGRPKGRPAPKPKPKDKTAAPKVSAAQELATLISQFSLDDIEELLLKIHAEKSENE